MGFIVVIVILGALIGLDRLVTARQRRNFEENAEAQEQFQIDYERLKGGRLFYIAIYIVSIIGIGIIADIDMGFTTEPDYETIKLMREDNRIEPTGDATKMFLKLAEKDTNGWIWGGFFIFMGILGLILKVSIFAAKLPINPYGDIQYVLNSIIILIGIVLIFRVPIYDFFGWEINVGYSYSELLRSIDNSVGYNSVCFL